jgi:hypothetical protein
MSEVRKNQRNSPTNASKSNDRDLQRERDGKASRPQQGLRRSGDGRERQPDLDRVVDEP